MSIKILPKNKPLRLVTGLTSTEFDCQCKYDFCRSVIISKQFLRAYKAFRKLVGVPLKINSGYRCTAHNFDVQGKPLSRHTTGEAVDISLKSLDHLSHEEIEHAAKLSGFTFVLFYKTFVHMDVRQLRRK
jgi:uncharacterized protein YcbK (DUF882 family)